MKLVVTSGANQVALRTKGRLTRKHVKWAERLLSSEAGEELFDLSGGMGNEVADDDDTTLDHIEMNRGPRIGFGAHLG